MVNFCDALDYCEVWGHDIEEGEYHVMDIIGSQERLDKCKRCGKEKYVAKPREMNPLYYNFGKEWH